MARSGSRASLDVKTEFFEPTDEAVGDARLVGTIEVLAAEAVVGDAAGEHVVGELIRRAAVVLRATSNGANNQADGADGQ